MSPHESSAATRVHIVTGSFGAGKTTTIRRLMAHKPEAEMWVVILNEFTAAGLDALNVAQSAHGAYDVRLIAGGCLCCVGELEFGRQLRDILRHLAPARLLIEPSGAGHAADIADELALYEAQGALRLDSVICLVDPLDAERILAQRAGNEWAQIQSADVLLLSKADVAQDATRRAFADIAAMQFPAKRFVGEMSHGDLPAAAMQAYSRPARFSLVTAPTEDAAASTQPFTISGLVGGETRADQLGFSAVSWILPRELTFARVVLEPRLRWMIEAYPGVLRRFKAVFRTGPGPSWLVQSHGHGLAEEDSAHRRDSRIEIVLNGAAGETYLEQWRSLLRDAAPGADERKRS